LGPIGHHAQSDETLGRRNVTPDVASILRGKLYNGRKKEEGAPKGNSNAGKQLGQNDPVVSTAETVAKETGVSPATVKRDAKYAEAAEKIGAITQLICIKLMPRRLFGNQSRGNTWRTLKRKDPSLAVQQFGVQFPSIVVPTSRICQRDSYGLGACQIGKLQ